MDSKINNEKDYLKNNVKRISTFPGLSFVQKKVAGGNCLEFVECELCVGITEMAQAFITHFDDRSIQVSFTTSL